MEGKNPNAPARRVIFCIKGHEIVYNEGQMIRNICPVCNSPIDRRRHPVPYEQIHGSQTGDAGQKTQVPPARNAVPENIPGGRGADAAAEKIALGRDHGPTAQPSFPEGGFGVDGIPRPEPPGRPAAETAPLPAFGAGGGVSRGRPGMSRPGSAGSTAGWPAKGSDSASIGGFGGESRFAPGRDPRVPPRPGPSRKLSGVQEMEPQRGGLCLNYFGQHLSIPAEGAWIGREGLGQQWFDGNLMISRKHVFVRPDSTGKRLQISQDNSLNGVFRTGRDGQRRRVEGADMADPGDVIWIYNIPLTVEL